MMFFFAKLFSVSCFITSVCSFLLGVFVLWKSSRQKVHIVWALTCLSIGFWSLGIGMMTRATNVVDAAFWNRWFLYGGATLIPVLYLHFVCLITRIHIRYLLHLFYAFAILELYQFLNSRFVSVRRCVPFTYYTQRLEGYDLFSLYFFITSIVLNILLLKGISKAQGNKQRQLQYIFIGTSIGFLGGATSFFYVYDIPIFPFGVPLVLLYTLTITYAIFRHQLMDIQFIIRRTLIYSSVSAILAMIYIAILMIGARLLERFVGSPTIFSSVIAGCTMTVLFHPLRNRIQRFIDQKFFRSKSIQEERLMALSSEVTAHSTLKQLTSSLGQTIFEAFHPKLMSLYLRDRHHNTFISVLSIPDNAFPDDMPLQNPWVLSFQKTPYTLPPDCNSLSIAVALPLQSRSELLGYLLLGEKRSDEPYTPEDLTLLRIVVNQVTVAFERPRLIDEISGGFIHEIKMPLANISLPAELTYMDLMHLADGTKNMAEVIEKSKTRMRFIMDQAALAAERIEAMRDITTHETRKKYNIHIKAAIQHSLESLQSLIIKTNVSISTHIQDSEMSIWGSEPQLEVLFTNLIKNALEAMAGASDPTSKHIHITADEMNHSVTITIEDSGPGIKASDLPHVFDRHFTTKGSSQRGLGLFLCKQIVQEHGGTITVESHEGKGTKFVIQIPLME